MTFGGRRPKGDEEGFTLIELMVVLLIIAILLAIAIPVFLGARQRASDRAAQSNVRNAHVTELIVYSDSQAFTDVINDLRAVDASIAYTQVFTALSPQGRVVYVEVLDPATRQVVVVGAKSASGKCFWIRTIGGTSQLRFAENDCAALPPDALYKDEW